MGKTAEELREEAARLLAEAQALEGDQPVTLLDETEQAPARIEPEVGPPPRIDDATAPARIAEDDYTPPARIGVEDDALPVDDGGEPAVRDPLETYDMSAELPELRQILQEKNYERAASAGNAEVWVQRGTKFMATLLADVNRRIRLEIRNPDGSMRTEISPAWPADVRLHLP